MFFSHHGRPRPIRGFTLLEVLLALSLSAIILIMVGSSMRLHARMVASERLGLEQAELARAILGQMARDLESAVQPSDSEPAPVNTGNAAQADDTDGQSENDAASDPAGGDTAGGDTAGGDQAERDAAGSPPVDDSLAGQDETATEQTIDPDQQLAIGLYGSSSELRWETMRAYNTLELVQAHDATINIDGSLPRSDLRTVAYFLGSASMVSGDRDPLTAILRRGREEDPAGLTSRIGSTQSLALLRLQIDYAAHCYLVENGGASTAHAGAAVLAAEVAELEFAYFDGIQWLPQWDSTVEGGLPVAVRIMIRLVATDGQLPDVTPSPSPNDARQSNDDTYSLIVRLPVGQPTADQIQEY